MRFVPVHRFVSALLAVGGLLFSSCRTSNRAKDSIALDDPTTQGGNASDPVQNELAYYEHIRIRDLQASKSCDDFRPEQGIVVTQRDQNRNAVSGRIRVLSDNPNNEIYIAAEYNDWGATKTDADKLRPVPETPYFEGTFRKLSHLMPYRLIVNGQQLLDPAATLYTGKDFLNSVFWDFERPDRFQMTTRSVDLRTSPIIIAESEVYELARKWPRGNQVGPREQGETYRFIAESGLIDELKRAGYNAVEFLPFNQSVDGDRWHLRYQVYGLFAPDAKYGTPDELAQMIDAFNRAGIAVIMDAVVGHYPFNANTGARALGPIGLHNWKKADGGTLYGSYGSPWNTYRYDYANPYIRRFLTDSVMHMMCRYGISGIRFDNLDGIKDYDGPGGGAAGTAFLKMLVKELRAYKPESVLIGEMFFGNNAVMKSLEADGFGFDFRTHSDYFDFLKDNMQKPTEGVDIGRLRDAIRKPWDWKEAPRVQYATNHDEAANRRDGATGSYLATLLGGSDSWYYVEKKTMAFAGLTMLSSAAYLDMPQLRLLQEGNFNEQSAVDWSLLRLASQKKVYDFFADLSQLVKARKAFAFSNYHPDIENHVDTFSGWRIISLYRRDPQTGKKLYAVVNLGHVGVANYKFGVDATGSFRVLIDSDAMRYGGSNGLEQRLPSGVVDTNAEGLHGRSRSITLPYLAPYGVVVLESQ